MKFKTIWVEGLQKVKDPIRIDLDPHYNSIRGPSDTGKSAIFTKSILLFTGKYDMYDIETLQNYECSRTTVAIELDDGFEYPHNRIMRADIENNHVTYSLFKENTILQVWQGYNKEISNIMGLITTDDICVNVLESTKRLFLDTTEDANTLLLEELFTNKELERKLWDINYYLSELDGRYKYATKQYELHNSKIRASRSEEITALKYADQRLDILSIQEKYLSGLNIMAINMRHRIKKKSLENITDIIILQELSRTISNKNIIQERKETIEEAKSKCEKLELVGMFKNYIEIKTLNNQFRIQLEKNRGKRNLLSKQRDNKIKQDQINNLKTLSTTKSGLLKNNMAKLYKYAIILRTKIVLENKAKLIEVNKELLSMQEQLHDISNISLSITKLGNIGELKSETLSKVQSKSEISKIEYAILAEFLLQSKLQHRLVQEELNEFKYCPLCNTLRE